MPQLPPLRPLQGAETRRRGPIRRSLRGIGRGIRWLAAGPVDWMGVSRIRRGASFIGYLLALLRAGLEPSSRVDCPRTITVNGRRYENYDDYPTSALGRIDLRTAFAQSCNTAFIGERDKLGPDDLRTAAASLGVGTDHDVGFPAYFGSVPTGGDANARAEAIFGQGEDQVSPLAMALVAASVEAGRTVLPSLIAGQRPTSTAAPLRRAEANQLRGLMRDVVTSGSGARLAHLDGPPVIAKTGTAGNDRITPLLSTGNAATGFGSCSNGAAALDARPMIALQPVDGQS